MSISVEEQLKILSGCGIRLQPDITIEHLLASFDRESYEAEPYVLLLTTIGGELEVEPFKYASDDIWHFDTECIEDHGDYTKIAHRMRDLAGSALPLEDIDDYVDIEEDEAWLSFKLNGEDYKWAATVEDDWVDPNIISQFAELLAERNVGKRFTYFDLGGQDCLIGCSSPEQLERLKNETGLNFQWLT
jgi:hypothetical protein